MYPELSSFIDNKAKLLLDIGPYKERPDVCDRMIHIHGNKEGFLGLMHFMFFASSELEDTLIISEIPFIISNLCKPLVLEIEYGENVDATSDGDLVETNSVFRWYLTEATLDRSAASIHNLAVNRDIHHVHFDPATHCKKAIAIYCSLD